MSSPDISLVLMGICLLISIVGSLMLLVAAFRESFLWGLVVLLLPVVSIFFLLFHWQDARKGFLLNLAGALGFLGIALTFPDRGNDLKERYAAFSAPTAAPVHPTATPPASR